ncbi:pentapeptide repeat-containing protein [Pseudomonas sp.]|uniref:pentapeptide repeat-containing protein n=1 Tax=Pseudomonas sp. TaxID=306 RepID=UPI0039C8C40C
MANICSNRTDAQPGTISIQEYSSSSTRLPDVGVPAPYPDALDDLRGLDLCKERLGRVSLTHSDLSFASFHLCNLTKARFQFSRLSWARNLAGVT